MQNGTDRHAIDAVKVSGVLTGSNPCKLCCHQSAECAVCEVMPMDVDRSPGQIPNNPRDSKPPDCSPPISNDRNDRKLIQSEFLSIQQLTAKFDMDACCDDRGENALVLSYPMSSYTDYLLSYITPPHY